MQHLRCWACHGWLADVILRTISVVIGYAHGGVGACAWLFSVVQVHTRVGKGSRVVAARYGKQHGLFGCLALSAQSLS